MTGSTRARSHALVDFGASSPLSLRIEGRDRGIVDADPRRTPRTTGLESLAPQNILETRCPNTPSGLLSEGHSHTLREDKQRSVDPYHESRVRGSGSLVSNKAREGATMSIESRLDVLVYRLKMARSIFQARQLINHGYITVTPSANSFITNALLQSKYTLPTAESTGQTTSSYRKITSSEATSFAHIHRSRLIIPMPKAQDRLARGEPSMNPVVATGQPSVEVFGAPHPAGEAHLASMGVALGQPSANLASGSLGTRVLNTTIPARGLTRCLKGGSGHAMRIPSYIVPVGSLITSTAPLPLAASIHFSRLV